MLLNMIFQHEFVICEHESCHVCKHDCCTWAVMRPRVPRGAIQTWVSDSIPDVIVASLGPELDFATNVKMHTLGKFAVAYLVLLPIFLEAFLKGYHVSMGCCCAPVDPQS